jgi:hypothetical protein
MALRLSALHGASRSRPQISGAPGCRAYGCRMIEASRRRCRDGDAGLFDRRAVRTTKAWGRAVILWVVRSGFEPRRPAGQHRRADKRSASATGLARSHLGGWRFAYPPYKGVSARKNEPPRGAANAVGVGARHRRGAGPPQGVPQPPRGAANAVSVGARHRRGAGPPQGVPQPPRGAANAVSVEARHRRGAGPPQGVPQPPRGAANAVSVGAKQYPGAGSPSSGPCRRACC